MELREIVRAWPTMVGRLQDEAPELGMPLARACRPLAAERYADGKLLTVLGCWWPADLAALQDPVVSQRLGEVLGSMLEDEVVTRVVTWPAGLAAGQPDAEGLVGEPDLLAGLPAAVRPDADRCETPLERWFFANAFRRGLRPECQHAIEHYRVDFAFPRFRVAAEILGWDTRHGQRERERRLGEQRWRVLWFAGEEVHADVGGCVDALVRALPREALAAPGSPSAAGRGGPRPAPRDRGYGDRRRPR